ncbi:MAG TPA: hypothetical protein VN721_15250 [Flavipsychrobacter sp.]|nr:hypothetical protein [Flavipsychrobacter sp.]
MENLQEKANFLKNEYAGKLTQLDVNAERKWGKMNVQQMIEHMSDYMRIANGRDLQKCVTPEDKLPAMLAFLVSEKPFRENTPNQLMPDTPSSARHNNKQDAITELQSEIDRFFDVYNEEKGIRITNPFFGDLDYDMQVQLLHKHAVHHLKQFEAVL